VRFWGGPLACLAQSLIQHVSFFIEFITLYLALMVGLVIKQTRLNSLFELLDYKQIKQTKRCILKCTNKSNVQSKFV
jgi:hypothetical protein